MVAMGILLVILVITFIFILGAGLLFLQMFSQKQTAAQPKPDAQLNPTEKPENKASFRWSYIILPLVLLLISVGIVIYFYGNLPNEVDLRLGSNGSLVSRKITIMWAIVPQVLLTLLAISIAYGATKISHMFNNTSAAGIKLDSILLIMSNMVVLPQLILLFAMLNIFSYNSFQTRIGFIWWIALAIIIVGLVLLSIFFIRAIRKIGSQDK